MTYVPHFMLAAVLSLTSTVARAEVCTFTTECFEGDGCYETAFEMTVENGQLISDAETIPVTSTVSEAAEVFVGNSGSAVHVLTRGSDGAARYSTHIFDGMLMLNYLGTCE